MAGRYLLDTNIAIAILEGELDLGSRLDEEVEMFLCAPVAGELCFGAEKSSRVKENLARIERLEQICPVILTDSKTARRYGVLKNGLRKKGRLIPENDLWIAATALQHDLSLVTRDAHFDAIEELKSERW